MMSSTLRGLTCTSEALLVSAWVTTASEELPSGPVTSDCPLLPSSVPAAACLAPAGSLCATFLAALEAGWARRLAFAKVLADVYVCSLASVSIYVL